MAPQFFLQFVPVARQVGFQMAQPPGRQLLDARAIDAHTISDLSDDLQPPLQSLQSALLLLHLLLPPRLSAGQCKEARLLRARLLKARCLPFDEVFNPILDALSLLMLALDLGSKGCVTAEFDLGRVQQCSLLCMLSLGSPEQHIGQSFGVERRAGCLLGSSRLLL